MAEQSPGRILEDSVKKSCVLTAANWVNLKFKKRGLDKRSPGVYSVCLPVLIFEETLCA